jgi:hypothetical protein
MHLKYSGLVGLLALLFASCAPSLNKPSKFAYTPLLATGQVWEIVFPGEVPMQYSVGQKRPNLQAEFGFQEQGVYISPNSEIGKPYLVAFTYFKDLKGFRQIYVRAFDNKSDTIHICILNENGIDTYANLYRGKYDMVLWKAAEGKIETISFTNQDYLAGIDAAQKAYSNKDQLCTLKRMK